MPLVCRSNSKEPDIGAKHANHPYYCSGCGSAIATSFEPAVTNRSGSASATAAWPSSADTGGLLTRIKNIVLAPTQEWPLIEAEPTTIAQLCSGYVLPLSLSAALLAFLRMSVIGMDSRLLSAANAISARP